MISDVMSSEESATEDDEMLIVKPLPWRSERVSRFFKQLDDRIEHSKKAQAKRQRKQRVLSNSSSVCPKPSALPAWCLADQ